MASPDELKKRLMIEGSDSVYRITLWVDREHFHQTRELVHFVSTQNGLDDSEADVVEMAVAEACHNGLRHGISEKDRLQCKLDIAIDAESIMAVVTGGGKEFEFNTIEPFNIHQDFLRYKDGGLGIPLIKALMDEVRYKRKPDNTNELTLVKFFNPKTKKRRAGST